MTWAVACTVADPAITESSGVAAAPGTDGWVWTHNDSGGRAELFLLDETCRTVRRVAVGGASAVDWEDVAATADGTVWVGDIGDNQERRASIVVHEVAPGASTATSHVLRYADGPRDAEALLVHDEVIHVVTKDPLGRSGVYRAGGDGVLHRIATVRLTPTGTAGGPEGLGFVAQLTVTGGGVSLDGSKVVLRTYTDAYEWRVRDGDLAATLSGRPEVRTPLPPTAQGEAVAYLADGRLVATTEGAGAPVHVSDSALVDEPAAPATTIAPADDGGRDRWWLAAAAAVLAVCGVVVLSRRRG